MGIYHKISGNTLNAFSFAPVMKPNKNPNPFNYLIVKMEQYGDYSAIMVCYPNCDNYEGNKIMVWERDKLKNMLDSKTLDPHFSNQVDSCIARFVPNDEGWDHALKFMRML